MSETNNHACACGCDHDHGDDCHHHHSAVNTTNSNPDLTAEESALFSMIEQYGCLPVAQFVLRNSKEESLYAIALAPVAIDDLSDSMEKVKHTGQILLSLEHKGLITLDYDIPITGYDYDGYRNSELFKYFECTVEENYGKPGFLFDTADIETGSMAIAEN